MDLQNPFASEIDGTPADLYVKGGTFIVDSSNVELFRGGFMGMGGFYPRPFRIKAGDRKKGHEHYINHLGLHASGIARLHWRSPDGRHHGIVESRNPIAFFHIHANYWHEIEAVTDVDWWCLFAKAEADRIYGPAAAIDYTLEKPRG